MSLIFSPRQLSLRSQFYQQFAQLTAAGVPVIKALQMLERNPPARSYRPPIRHLLVHLAQGGNFTDALRQLGRWLPSFDLALIQAGEHSGRLNAVCKILADYYEDRARLLRQMITDLAYPLFIFHFGLFLLAFVTLFLTGNIKMLFLQTVGVLVPLYGLALFIIIAMQGSHGLRWRSLVESILRPLPMLGTGRHYLALSRLAIALEALLAAGVTIIEAWDLAAAASGSPAIARAVAAWKPAVLAGQTPAEEVRNSPLFPEMFSNFYASGEASGQLDDSLKRLHQYYDEEGRRKLHLVAVWFPRLVYISISLLIGYVIIRMGLSYFNEIDKAIGP